MNINTAATLATVAIAAAAVYTLVIKPGEGRQKASASEAQKAQGLSQTIDAWNTNWNQFDQAMKQSEQLLNDTLSRSALWQNHTNANAWKP